MSDIKLLALDMDGTTYGFGGEIIKENIPAIQDALKAGVEVVVVTGRPALARQNKMKENGFGEYGKSLIVACNGGCVYDFMEDKIVEQNPINTELAKKVFDLVQLDEFKDVEIWGYVNDLKTAVISRKDNHTPGFEFEEQFFDGKFLQYESVKEKFDYKFFKLLGFNTTPKFVEAVKKLGLTVATTKREVNCEINAPGVNKGTAVKQLAEKLGLNRDQVMAIGDGSNDLPMIEYAGNGVALENSIPEIKQIAKFQVPLNNEQGGVAYAINKWILGK